MSSRRDTADKGLTRRSILKTTGGAATVGPLPPILGEDENSNDDSGCDRCTHVVDPSSSTGFNSIQTAIDSTEPPSGCNFVWICVAQDTYAEQLSVNVDHTLILQWLNANQKPTIAPSTSGPAIDIQDSVFVIGGFEIEGTGTPQVRIKGVETNAFGSQVALYVCDIPVASDGTGIYQENSDVLVKHCTISQSGAASGTGTGVTTGGEKLSRLRLGGNIIEELKRGAHVTTPHFVAGGNRVRDNAWFGFEFQAGSRALTDMTLKNNTFRNNHVGTLFFEDGSTIAGATLRQNNFIENTRKADGTDVEFIPPSGVATLDEFAPEGVGNISVDVDARRNWWNARTGPERHVPREGTPVAVHVSRQDGDYVTDGVSFRPWSVDGHGTEGDIPDLIPSVP